MNIFFLCRTGHHTSIIAALLYLQEIGKNEFSRDLVELPGYDQVGQRDVGKPFFVGRGSSNSKIFTLGVSRESRLLARAAHELTGLFGVSPGEFRVVDTSPFVSRWTDLGLFCKRLRLKSLARLFFYLGVRRERVSLAKLLAKEREQLS